MSLLPDTILPSVTGENYLKMEEQSEVRHEYFNGIIRAMAGASREHNIITLNLAATLLRALANSPFTAFVSDTKLNVKTNDTECFLYPDVMVSCEQQKNKHYCQSPIFVAEISSPSTVARDMMEKLAIYSQLESVKEYLIISQDEADVIQYSWQEGESKILRWTGLDATLSIACLSVEMSIKDLYQGAL